MLRRLLNLLTALSLLLCMAVCVLWVRSYKRTDLVCVNVLAGYGEVASSRGSFFGGWHGTGRIGIGVKWVLAVDAGCAWTVANSAPLVVVVPHGVFAAATATLPLLRVFGRRRQARPLRPAPSRWTERGRFTRLAAAASLAGCAVVAFFWLRSLNWYEYRLSIGEGTRLTLRSTARRCAFTVTVTRRPEGSDPSAASVLEVERYWWSPETRRHHPPPAAVFPWFSHEAVRRTPGRIRGLFTQPDGSERAPVVVGHTVLLPQWAVLVVTAVLPAWLAAPATVRWTRGRSRQRAGLCPSCGYDLRTTPVWCPECGAGRGVQA